MSSIIQSALKMLIDADELIINGLGVLYKAKETSYVHPITKEVAPPQKTLNFRKETAQTAINWANYMPKKTISLKLKPKKELQIG